MFGLLIRGLRVGMDMLMAIQDQGHTTSLSKVVALPMLSGSEGLDKFLVQFEGVIDSDFPNYQVLFDYLCTKFLCLEFLLDVPDFISNFFLCIFSFVQVYFGY